MGGRLIPLLQSRGHSVTAVAREGSQRKLPPGCEVVIADVLNAIPGSATFGLPIRSSIWWEWRILRLPKLWSLWISI